jgi:hypothetical protein
MDAPLSLYHPASRRPRPLADEECANVWLGCHPAYTLERGLPALTVGLHFQFGFWPSGNAPFFEANTRGIRMYVFVYKLS